MSFFAKKLIAIIIASSSGGCILSPPNFNIPTNDVGTPRTKSIVQRIRCQLTELIRDDIDNPFPERDLLIRGDYQFAASLYLDVIDKAGLTPNVTFPDTAKYFFGVGGQADLSREDSLTVNIEFSLNQIKRDLEYNLKNARHLVECPKIDTPLAGDLGLRRSAGAALETAGIISTTDLSPSTGEFSGTIQFISTLAITSAGPMWTFAKFTGPGQFASASRVYTDKITYAFASGKNANSPLLAAAVAKELVQIQTQNDGVTQLSGLRNLAR